MKSLRLHPLLPLLPLCLAVSLASAGAPSQLAVEATARSLDWSQAAPKPPGSAMATNPAGARGTAAAALPVPDRAFATPVQPAVDGKPAERMATKRTTKAHATRPSKGLFALEDRAIIIVGGKQTTAGEVKRALQAELVAKAGAAKIVKGGARKLDLGMHVAAGPKPSPFGVIGGIGSRLPRIAATSTTTPSRPWFSASRSR